MDDQASVRLHIGFCTAVWVPPPLVPCAVRLAGCVSCTFYAYSSCLLDLEPGVRVHLSLLQRPGRGWDASRMGWHMYVEGVNVLLDALLAVV